MGRIIFERDSFRFEQIKEQVPALRGADFATALVFCHEWLNGKTSFTLHTSGSTGQPKPITLDRMQLETSAQATIQALRLSQQDTALVCLNTAYIAGIMMLVRGMVAGMDLVLVQPDSSPLQGLKADLKIDFAAMVPLQLQTILEENNPKDIRLLNGMKAIIVGGAPVNERLEARVQTLSAPVFLTYGMTETVSHIALRRLNGEARQEYYQTLPGVLIDTDERGALKILSPVTHHQWLQTNDLAELIGPTEFRWLGRADYIINSGGVKIQPEKIEKSIEPFLSRQGIQQFFVQGLPHPQWGEAVTLFIESDEKKENLLEELRPVLDRYALPKAVIAVKKFSRTATGKIERKKIANEFLEFYFD